MKKLLLLGILILALNSTSQITLIPDVNFEQALIDQGYDTGSPDGSVPTANISSVIGLNVASSNIFNLTGIQDFTSLTWLNCEYNQLSSLDVSQNTALSALRCYWNDLTSLDVSQNTALTYLDCSENWALTSLVVNGANALTQLGCSYNQLTTLDVSQNTSLTNLWCSHNQLISLILNGATELIHLECDFNQLTTLDVSTNTALTHLYCNFNQLTSLDVSQNSSLTYLHCGDNQLECLNLKNNTLIYLYAWNNPNLLCISVSNVAYANANWGAIDAQTSFSTNCGNPCTLGITELNSNSPKQLSKIIDFTGREIQFKKNTLMLYIYEDGSSERVIEIE